MTTETLMTAAAQTTEGASASQPAAAGATGAPGEGQQQSQTPAPGGEGEAGKPGEPAKTGGGTDGKDGTDGAKPEGEQKPKDEAKKPDGAPERYDFKPPEGVSLDAAVVEAFSGVAKELGLTQDNAQLILDKVTPAMQARQTERMQAAAAEWEQAAKADSEFGGDKLGENLAVAKKALDQFATPELRALLNESGLGNHPEIIRAFYRAGKAISEDRFVGGQPGAADKSGDARRLYAASNMNP
jgi:hypothetical protein